jgi:hypothetical protein
MEFAIFPKKNQRLQLRIQTVTLNHLNKLFLWYHAFQPLGNYSHMAASRSSSKITSKMKSFIIFASQLGIARALYFGVCN